MANAVSVIALIVAIVSAFGTVGAFIVAQRSIKRSSTSASRPISRYAKSNLSGHPNGVNRK